MWFAILPILTQSAPKQVDIYSLSFYQEQFVVRRGTQVVRLPLRIVPPRPPTSVAFRKNQTYAVWDDRGLTIRSQGKLVSTRLAEIAVSPRMFPKPEIIANLARFKSHERSRDADALTGARRIGPLAYFLVRWDDRNGKPWLEALIRVNLAAVHPKPQLLGHFDGLSTSKNAINDLLAVKDQTLQVVTQAEGGWGFGIYSTQTRSFDFRRMGAQLLDWRPDGRFIESSEYGTTIGGRTDSSFMRSTLFETRGSAKFVDDDQPTLAVLQSVPSPALRNLATGAELLLPAKAAVRRFGPRVVVWSPYDHPRKATLYSIARFEPLAEWRDSDLLAPKPKG